MADFVNKYSLHCLTFGNNDLNDIISPQLYTDIIQLAFDTLLRQYTQNNNQDKENIAYNTLIVSQKNSQIPDFYHHLLIFISECVKNDISYNEIKNMLLNDNILNIERIDEFIGQYQRFLAPLRFEMMKYRVTFTTIVDFKWRLDYNVHSSVLEDMKDNTYVLTFTVVDNGVMSDISFNCDLAQLNDLFGHVKDAQGKKQ